MLLRPGVSRALLRGFPAPTSRPIRSFNGVSLQLQLASKRRTSSHRRPQLLPALPSKPVTTALVRYASTAEGPYDKIDRKAEAEYLKERLESHPELVSTSSSMHPVFGEVGVEDEEKDVDMMASIKSDIATIKETFSLQDVPREAFYVGMAGVLPYLATSVSTIYCAWEIQHAHRTGLGFLFSEQQAEHLLHILEPLQTGYGAVILSFLGAIHWGLEWAGYGGQHGYRRYAIGVIAPAVAWPTILLPAQYALISQFLAFTFLYNADANASRRGLAPPWYGTYRFVLTFIVGSSIILTLIGRSNVGDKALQTSSPLDRLRQFPSFGVESEEAKEAEEEEDD